MMFTYRYYVCIVYSWTFASTAIGIVERKLDEEYHESLLLIKVLVRTGPHLSQCQPKLLTSKRRMSSFENKTCHPPPTFPCPVPMCMFFFFPVGKRGSEPPACPNKTIKQLRRKAHSFIAPALFRNGQPLK